MNKLTQLTVLLLDYNPLFIYLSGFIIFSAAVAEALCAW